MTEVTPKLCGAKGKFAANICLTGTSRGYGSMSFIRQSDDFPVSGTLRKLAFPV